MNRIDSQLLDTLCAEAAESPRRRSHRLLHENDADTVQRLLVGVQPGTIIPPHHHVAPAVWEAHICLRGQYDLLVFAADGVLSERLTLGGDSELHMTELDGLGWHSLVATRPDTVLLEFKPGPFNPEAAKVTPDFAPAEGDADAAAWERWARSARVGDRYQRT